MRFKTRLTNKSGWGYSMLEIVFFWTENSDHSIGDDNMFYWLHRALQTLLLQHR